MRKLLFALLLVTLATGLTFAQNSTQIFSASKIGGNWSDQVTYDSTGTLIPSRLFNSADVELECNGSTNTAVIAGKSNSNTGIIVDNFLAVNGTWKNPATDKSWCNGGGNWPDGSCFGSFVGPITDQVYNLPVEPNYPYQPTSAPVNISSVLKSGGQVLAIELWDGGQINGNGNLYLVTSCKILKQSICHKPGTPAQNQMLLPPSAVAGHLGHGDILGACPESN